MSLIRPKSFHYAFEGIRHTIKNHPNFSVHIFISLIILLATVILGINRLEFAIILLTISVGLALELVNTSIEAVVDLITKEWRVEAKIAKDTAAAAMLIYALGAVMLAVTIFVPKLMLLF